MYPKVGHRHPDTTREQTECVVDPSHLPKLRSGRGGHHSCGEFIHSSSEVAELSMTTEAQSSAYEIVLDVFSEESYPNSAGLKGMQWVCWFATPSICGCTKGCPLSIT